MTRRLKNGVLQAFIDYTKETEIPEKFALWTGISVISATLSRNVFVDMGHFTVYPNTYIVLVAGSARCRKSTSIGVASRFLGKIDDGVKLLSQKMTPEALISSLSGSGGDNKTLVSSAEGILVVDELATLIDKNAFNSGLIPILTKLYDSEDFTYETRGRGVEHILNPCLSILGGSTLHWIKESIPKVAIGGGFTSRVIFVYKDKPDNLVAFPITTAGMKKIGDDVVNDLNELRKMKGRFQLSKDAIVVYEKEYKRFMSSSDLFDSENLSGYAGRRHVTLMKVVMAVAASFKNSLVIDDIDMKMAIEFMNMIEGDMPIILQQIQNEEVGNISDEVIRYIMNKREVYRSDLVRKMNYKITAGQLDVIINTLLEFRDKAGNKILDIQKDGDRTKYVYLK